MERAAPPDLFVEEVLRRLDPMDRTMLAQVWRPWLAAVLASGSRRACPGVTVRLRLEEFFTSVERLAWAKANGCPWGLPELWWARQHGCQWNVWTRLCTPRYGRAPGGAAVRIAFALNNYRRRFASTVLELFQIACHLVSLLPLILYYEQTDGNTLDHQTLYALPLNPRHCQTAPLTPLTPHHSTQYHATMAAILPNITPLRPPFYPISRQYGRHSTQYHASTAAILPNITPLRPPFYPISRQYGRHSTQHDYHLTPERTTTPRAFRGVICAHLAVGARVEFESGSS